jgi:uncharacterized membrane protein (DUF106 family)
MNLVHAILDRILNVLFSPFLHTAPAWPLLLTALVTSLLFLWVYKQTVDPVKVKASKDRIQAHLLELRLFKDSPRIMFSALGNALIHNVRYVRSSLKPLALMLLPIVLLLVQLEGWYGHNPLRPGEAAVVSVSLATSDIGILQRMTLQCPRGIAQETPPLRLPSAQEVSWAIRGKEAGTHRVVVQGPDRTYTKTVVVSDGTWARVWPQTVTSGFWNQFWNPGEAALSPTGFVRQITVSYSDRSIDVFGWEMHWLLAFFLASCLFGWIASRFMKVVI